MERIYHRWENWECYPAGFFEVHPPKGMTDEECEETYKELLTDIPEFKRIMYLVIRDWPNSCEHNLTNERMNRIAWMGQAALCYKYGIPSRYRGGYHRLSEKQKYEADKAALEVINYWRFLRGYASYTMKEVESKTQMDLY